MPQTGGGEKNQLHEILIRVTLQVKAYFYPFVFSSSCSRGLLSMGRT